MAQHEARDTISGIIVMILGLAVIVLSHNIPTLKAMEVSGIVDSRFFPRAVGVLLSFFGLILLLLARVRAHEPQKDQAPPEEWKATPPEASTRFWQKPQWRVAIAMIVTVFFPFALNALGFIVSSIVAMVVLLKFLGGRSWFFSLATAIGVSVAVYAVFRYGLGVVLPQGLVTFL